MHARQIVQVLSLVLLVAAAPGYANATGTPIPAPAAPLCREHGVLESVCTKCNPALIPVFKAKGDWCDEHGFPESLCPICHPERGGLPQADVSSDGAPLDGTKVQFKTKDTARLAGIETVAARAQAERAAVDATATIVFDATRVAEVNARAAGVVRTINADVGTTVVAGGPLAVIESADFGAEQSRLSAASSRLGLADATYRRLNDLHREGIAPEREVLAARQEVEAARAELASTRAALGVIGPEQNGAARYTVSAPIAGVVTRRAATIGERVGAGDALFEVVDTSVMWAQVDVPEAVLASVAVGQTVAITVDGVGDRQFGGTISYLAPAIDLRTRTALARVALQNPEGVLRANMFGRAAIAVKSDGASAVVVPAVAVQRAGGVRMVFVRLGEDAFETRRVRVGAKRGDAVEISGRVAPGDAVVTVGGFLLKTETLKGSIGAGCCAGD
jgi:cobalt-zinc-cadmium efflux system membrane fusion protein